MVVRCNCGVPAKVMKSWTHENPGRRFYACKFKDYYNEEEGCGFFGWHDKNQEAWQKGVINDLVLEKRMLEHEMRFLKNEIHKSKDLAAAAGTDSGLMKLKLKKRPVLVKRNGFVFGVIVGALCLFLIIVTVIMFN